MSGRVIVLQGDAANLPLPDSSVDAVVTDPPYALTELPVTLVAEALAAWVGGDRAYVPETGAGFMGRSWDKFVPPPAAWDECLRVLKPGGHVLAFAAPRTQDLMGISIRLAGFEIRDGIDWIFGTGYPKSMDVTKAIDKAAGAEREVVGHGARFGRGSMRNKSRVELGYRPTELNPDGGTAPITTPATEEAVRWSGFGTALKPAHEPILLARKPLAGTVAQNVLTHGTGALNVNGCRVGSGGQLCWAAPRDMGYGGGTDNGSVEALRADVGRWPPNILLGEEAATEMDRQSGTLRARGNVTVDRRSGMGYHGANGNIGEAVNPGDSGGASRFFPVFRYEAKADSRERPRLNDGTAWPTVKPLGLMRWLIRLVTPPGGVVGDFFCGTGTTGEAALIEGFSVVLADKDPQALALTRVRLAKPLQPVLFGDFDEEAS